MNDHMGALSGFSAAVARGAKTDPQVLNNLANVLMHLGRFAESLQAFDDALAIRPDLVDALYNRASALKSMQRYEEALVGYQRVISLQPDHARAFLTMADTLNAMGRFPEALEAITRYMRLELATSPGQHDRLIALGRCLYQFECLPAIYRDTAELTQAREQLDQLVQELATHVDALSAPLGERIARLMKQLVLKVSLFFVSYQQLNDIPLVSSYSRSVRKLLGTGSDDAAAPPISGKIRVGIASEYLRDHNGSKWAYEWVARLPAEKYEFFCHAFHAVEDDFTRKFAQVGTFRRHLFSEDNLETVISQMRQDRLHALLLPDVGMTGSSRVLSQYRVAPVQFTAWGHPVTTGSPNIDFYLSGDLMEPENGGDHYSETLVRLPNLGLYLTRSNFDGIDAHRFGVPDDRVLFGAVQSLTKYLPQYDEIFPAIAKRVEGALFAFYEGLSGYASAVLKERLQAAFAAQGLDSAHFVRFLPRTGWRDYVAFLKAVDVNVDTIGWSGGYTTLQMLEAECPTVTLPTEFMRGRMSAAMLRRIGSEELIADSIDDFVSKLARLGQDRPYRDRMAARIAASKHLLFEDASVIEALDQFLQREVRRRCAHVPDA